MKPEGTWLRRTFSLPATLVGVLVAGSCSEPSPEVPPRQISESPFQYPEALWDAGVEGETVLELHVSAGGTVDSARVQRTSGHAEFDSAAVRDARQLRFEPAKRGDENVAVRVLLPVQYTISGDSPSATAASVDSVPPEP